MDGTQMNTQMNTPVDTTEVANAQMNTTVDSTQMNTQVDNTQMLPEPEEQKQPDKKEKKAKEIIGLPVVSFKSGTKIYEVEDMIVDPDRRQVLALVVSEGSLFHSARAIPFGRVSAIGSDAVIVPDGKAVIDVNRDKVLKSLHNDNRTVKGLRVLTDDASKLGEIVDFLLDTKTGEIRGYYVSTGRMASVGQGLRWLPADSVISMGERVAYVPAQVARDFDNQAGGLAGALTQAGYKVRTAGTGANTRLEQFGGKARATGEKFNEQLVRYGDQVRDTLPQQATSALVGKTAHQEVATPDGTPIVREGDTITEEHVETAKTTGRLPQLFVAAGVGPARDGVDNFGAQAGQSWNDMRTEARVLWSQITGNYTRVVDQSDDKFMQRRVKNALGRPVTRVILDADDHIILNTGDIITNRAIQAAREAGVLDVLVDSVYTEGPKLSVEELKAPHSGEASLEKYEVNGASSRADRSPRPVPQHASDNAQTPAGSRGAGA